VSESRAGKSAAGAGGGDASVPGSGAGGSPSGTGSLVTEALEHAIEVTRSARYYTLGPARGAVRELWVVLHGYRQLARRFLQRFRPLDDGSRLLLAPEALSRFYVDPSPGRHGPESRVGATWMTREDREREIGDYVRYLDRVLERVLADLSGPPRSTVVLGFSQGCQTAARWVVLGSVRPDRLILWGDHAPPDLPEQAARKRLAGVRVTVVQGTRDPSLGGAGAEVGRPQAPDRLSALGIAWTLERYEGGHEIDPVTLAVLAGEGEGVGGG
jgi:predicted esterase